MKGDRMESQQAALENILDRTGRVAIKEVQRQYNIVPQRNFRKA